MPKAGATSGPTGSPKSADEAPSKATSQNWFVTLDDSQEFTKALFYGVEGTGKTTALASAANGGRVLIINAEGGLKKRALQRQGINTDNIAVWPNPESGETITARSLEALHEKLRADLLEDPNSWFAVGLDSVSDIHQLLREQATDDRVTRSKVALDPDFVDRDDYGKMTGQMRKIIRRFRDLPCHVILTALEKDDEDSNQIVPAITPALRTDILGYMDIVLRFGSPDGSYRGRSKNVARIRAKDRYGVLPEVLAEPSFERIEGYLDGSLDAETDEFQTAMATRDAEARKAAEAAKAERAAKRKTSTASKKAETTVEATTEKKEN